MRGRRNPQASMLAFVDLDERVPPQHPLRTIKRFADRALSGLSPTFNAMYGSGGRPSLPPERFAESQSANQLVLGTQRARVLRRARLPTAVALVPGHELDRAELRPVHVQQEPRTAVEVRGRSAVLRRRGPPG